MSGRRAEGFVTIDEATVVYRRLAEEIPDAYLPELVRSLNTLSSDLAGMSRRAEGLAAVEEATTVYRRLPGENLAADLYDVLTSLKNIGSLSRKMVRTEGGNSTAEKMGGLEEGRSNLRLDK